MQTLKTIRISTARGLAAATIVGLASPALGWTDPEPSPVTQSRFVPQARLAADGKKLVVSGNANCGAEGVLQVTVSVLQHASLASVRGLSVEQPCTAQGLVPFTAEIAVPEGKPAFAAGPAEACALAQTRAKPGAAADYDLWCVFINLAVDKGL